MALDRKHEEEEDQRRPDTCQRDPPEAADEKEDGDSGREPHSRHNEDPGQDDAQRDVNNTRGLFLTGAVYGCLLVRRVSRLNTCSLAGAARVTGSGTPGCGEEPGASAIRCFLSSSNSIVGAGAPGGKGSRLAALAGQDPGEALHEEERIILSLHIQATKVLLD